jgi:hypothetical protein
LGALHKLLGSGVWESLHGHGHSLLLRPCHLVVPELRLKWLLRDALYIFEVDVRIEGPLVALIVLGAGKQQRLRRRQGAVNRRRDETYQANHGINVYRLLVRRIIESDLVLCVFLLAQRAVKRRL